MPRVTRLSPFDDWHSVALVVGSDGDSARYQKLISWVRIYPSLEGDVSLTPS